MADVITRADKDTDPTIVELAALDGGSGSMIVGDGADSYTVFDTTAAGRSILELTDPDADRVSFWDDSEGSYGFLTVGTGLAISTTTLALSHLGLEALSDPGADRIAFWDDSAGAFQWLTVGSGLQISTTTISVNSAGLDADTLDSQEGTYYLDWTNFTNTPTTAVGYGISNGSVLDATTASFTTADETKLDYITVTGAVDLDNDFQPASANLTTYAGIAPGAGGQALLALTALSEALSGYIYGLELSNNATDATNDIDIAAGRCIDSTNTVLFGLSAVTKRLDAAWQAGTGNGMRNSAVAIADTTYHLFAVCKAGGADPDVYAIGNAQGSTASAALTALQAETGGSDYIYARRIGAVIRASSANLVFTQSGDEILLDTPINDITANNPGDSAVTRTLSVPAGIVVDALVLVQLLDTTVAADSAALLTSLDQADTAASTIGQVYIQSTSGTPAVRETAVTRVRTNTSAQIRSRLNGSTTDHFLVIHTMGWIDTRGRLA